jgi:hypothetical protein
MTEPTPTWQRWGVLALVLGLFVGGGFLLVRSPPSPEPGPAPPAPSEDRSDEDPRLTYAGPYLNVRPGVKYLGDAACADCHTPICDSFHQHPMGRSLRLIATAPPPDGGRAAPFTALGADLRVERSGGRTWHHESRTAPEGWSVYDRAVEIKYVVGSGTHAESYLSEQDGYVQQTPITWFGQKHVWDQSPGWHGIGGDRPVRGRCLYCHAGRVEPLPGYQNRFASPVFRSLTVDCERCHGPGEKHVARWAGDDPGPGGQQDFTIVNPRKLDWRLREAVCRQCHSEGETRQVKRGRGLFDYRPGMPLEAFWQILVLAEGEEEFKVVNHVEQLERSRCFKMSTDANKLGCISCHDPHVKPVGEARLTHFRQACLKCHTQHGCALPEPDRRRQQPQDSCIDCHMARSASIEIPHISGTDHRILRRPAPPAPEPPDDPRMPDGLLPVRLMHRGTAEPLPAEERRDLGVGLAELLTTKKLAPRHTPRVLELLDEALRTVPADPAAWVAKAKVLDLERRSEESFAAYQEALKLDPGRETALTGAGLIAIRLGRTAEGIDLWKRAVERNPWRPLHHAGLAILYGRTQQWREAKEAADAWVRLEPGAVEARQMRTQYLLRLGDRAGAAEEFARIEALRPPNLDQLRAWWAAETQPGGR